ncbi:putrescine aminopropyltransferase [Fusarium falciforme]|nr:putrescine aminopropyltransferase [Fusarium falciforme]
MTLPWSVLRWVSRILPASPPGRSGYVQARRGCELVKKTSLAPFSTLSSPLAVGFIGSSLHRHRHSQLALPLSHSLRFFSTMSSEEITHETIKDGWFREISEMWPGQAMTLRVEKVLVHEKSKYQDVLIFKSTDFGNVLVLDNVVQCTERDEFSYQEMITHLAMNSHPNPKKVLVIGGGDGGVLREIVKHDCVEEAILCDIDEAVVRLSKQYLPTMSVGFDHPKVKVHIGDGFKFLNDYKNEFDVIITDSSDPEGPAEALFEKNYFKLLHDALKEGGVISTQAENQWLHLPLITQLKKDCRSIFPVAEYAYTTIPTYPSGQIGFMVCSKDPNADVKTPLRQWTKEEEDEKCRYYSSEIHKASFVLPKFAEKALE